MPKNKNWLDNVFVSELVYVYQAALLCEDCGLAIVKKLKEAGREDDGNADDFPQGPYREGGDEADSPGHCDRNEACVNAVQVPGGRLIGCPLGNPLTNYGQEQVTKSICTNVLAKSAHSRAVGRLWRLLYDYLRPEHLLRINVAAAPANLGSLLDELPRDGRVPPEFYTDLDYLYGSSLGREEVLLWRAEIEPDGSFSNLKTVALPAREFPGRTIEDALDEAWKDGAWD